MNLTVNGESHTHRGDGSVPALLAELGASPEHAALTVNGEILFSREWPSFRFAGGESIEVLTFVGGG